MGVVLKGLADGDLEDVEAKLKLGYDVDIIIKEKCTPFTDCKLVWS